MIQEATTSTLLQIDQVLRDVKTCIRQEQWEMAKTLCLSVIHEDDASVLGHKLLGYCYYAQKNYSGALDMFKRALSLQKNDVEVLNYIATTLSKLGQLNASISTFEMALKIHPNHPRLQHNLLITLKKKYH